MKPSMIYWVLALFTILSETAFAKLPPGFKETAVVKSLTSPSSFSFAPDGRLFIGEQTGKIRIFQNGTLLTDPFTVLEVDDQGEHGILGMTFDPQFDQNPYLYVYYTAKTPYIHNRVSRFKADQNSVPSGSEQIILDLDDVLGSIFHSAGGMHFGPDGTLFIGVGDNGGKPAMENAQLLTNPFGKLLRINADGSIPSDNPFFSQASGIYRSIWARGLRNPFTFSFQPGTGRLFINDVGSTDWEEINEGEAGGNYGWPEGAGMLNLPQYKNPVFTYAHGGTGDDKVGCAITGGTFYNPSTAQFPAEYNGTYFFIDYCNNWMRMLDPKSKTVSTFGKDLAPNPVGLEVGPDGGLYYLSRWLNGIYRIGYKPPTSARVKSKP